MVGGQWMKAACNGGSRKIRLTIWDYLCSDALKVTGEPRLEDDVLFCIFIVPLYSL